MDGSFFFLQMYKGQTSLEDLSIFLVNIDVSYFCSSSWLLRVIFLGVWTGVAVPFLIACGGRTLFFSCSV